MLVSPSLLFEKEYLSTKWDLFKCFNQRALDGREHDDDELPTLAGTDKPPSYQATMNGPRGDGTDIPPPVTASAPPKPIRKPDPDLRVLQKQLSFGSGSRFGSLGRKATIDKEDGPPLSPPPVVTEEGESTFANESTSFTNPSGTKDNDGTEAAAPATNDPAILKVGDREALDSKSRPNRQVCREGPHPLRVRVRVSCRIIALAPA